MPKNSGATVLLVLLGAVLGGYLGELLGLLIPSGLFHDLLVKGFSIGFDSPLVFDLRVIVLTFGMKIYINLFAVIGMIIGLYYSK